MLPIGSKVKEWSNSKFLAHFIREAIEQNELQLNYCRFEDQMANILIKALPIAKFQMLRRAMGVQGEYIKNGECY